MLSLAERYHLKPYSGDVLLISANEEYFSQFSREIWKKIHPGHFYDEEVCCVHLNILEDPNNKMVADILNKYLGCPSKG
jgi:hypothetical protein